MDMLPSLTKEDTTLEAEEQIIDPLVEIEPPIITSPTENAIPEETQECTDPTK